MFAMNVLRRTRLAVALTAAALAAAGLAVAGLAVAGLAIAPAAHAAGAVPASPVPAGSAPAGLHVTGTIDLGRLGTSFSYVLTEARGGDVYYALGKVVYRVKGDHAPVAVLHASAPVLAVAATSADLLVDVGSKVSAYSLCDGRLLRSWNLPGSIAPATSAGLFPVGNTVWADTDWATDQSGFEYANVYRFDLSSPAVHVISKNDAYPADLAADSAGLYYEAITGAGTNGYVYRAAPAGPSLRHLDVNIDAPLALASGNVYLLAIHENQGGHSYLDAFRGSTLSPLFSYRVSDSDTDVAGTGLGLLLLGGGKVSLLNPANGHSVATLHVPGAVTLVPGPFAAVVTVSHSTTYLLRLGR
jgi:hypothetical protein